MYVVQYVLLFGASVVLGVAAFLGYARGFAGVLGTFSWFVTGNASAAVVYYDGAGVQHVATSVPLTWLCYGVAAMHVVVVAIAVHETFIASEGEPDSIDDLPKQLDPNMTPDSQSNE